MKVDIIKTETIKPSTPTPQHLKTLKLSVLDQTAPSEYPSLVLFYSNDDTVFTSDEISQTLKKSLSETLVSFYPLAGKVNLADSIVECDDSGATFVEAEFAGPLSAILENRYDDESRMLSFLPPGFRSIEPGVCPLLVQATFFAGGGFALGVAVSHKLVDGATLALFLTAWTASSGEAENFRSISPGRPLLASPPRATKVAVPDFISGRVQFPAIDFSLITLNLEEKKKLEKEEWVTRRFVFDKSAITALKAKSTGSARPPSRVEAVTALVWKCAATAAKWPKSVLVQLVNLRTRVDPPFPGNTAGNLIMFFSAGIDGEAELQRASALEDLVGKLRLGLEEFVEHKAKKLRGDDKTVLWECLLRGKDVISGGSHGFVVVSSSWCRFGFYRVDLGFGRPAYVAGNVQSDPRENRLTLMDTRDGEGVEICLTLTKQNMASLVCDPVFLAFICKNNS